MPDRMPEDMSEYMPDYMPEDMPDRMPDRMPEDLPNRMPEDMPDRMPEDMPNRMPEDLPVRQSINVTVGITRSKVILQYKFCLGLFGCSSLPIFLVWTAPLLQHLIRTKVGHFIRYQSWRIQKSFHSGFGLSWFDFSSHFVGYSYRTGNRSHKPVDESIYESKIA